MSVNVKKVCYRIIEEHFGNIVAQVSDCLFTNGSNPLLYIHQHTKLPLSKVKEALCGLVKHNLVTYDIWKPDIPAYNLLHDRILLIVRFPRYVFTARELFGEEAEMVIDVLLKEGQVTASHTIINASLKLLKVAEGDGMTSTVDCHVRVRNAFSRLLAARFIQRCPSPQTEDAALPVLTVTEEELYKMPADIDLRKLKEEIAQRSAGPEHVGEFPYSAKTLHNYQDNKQYFRINYDRFHIEFRDMELCNSLSRRIDPMAGTCFRSILKLCYMKCDPWLPVMSSVTAAEIRDQPKEIPTLDQYLKVLESDSGGCFQRVGDAGGGEYQVNIVRGIESLTASLMERLVQERFGSKGARIFRLVCINKMMEQEQIGELGMIGKREANILAYQLVHDNFFQLQEVRKTISPSPANKSTFLFHVNMKLLVRMVLEWCYKALYNLMVHRESLLKENKRLLEKKTRVESVVENLKASGVQEDQIQEVQDMLTSVDRAAIEKVLAIQDQLLFSEMGIDEQLFVLQMYLYYQS